MAELSSAERRADGLPRTHPSLFRFPPGSIFESCGVAAIDCPACGVRTLADGVSVRRSDGLGETHRHLRCRLCGAPSRLPERVSLQTDGLPPDDQVYPAEAFVGRSHPGLLDATGGAPATGTVVPDAVNAGGAPRHQRAFLYGVRYEFEKPRPVGLLACLWPLPVVGLSMIAALTYGAMYLVSSQGVSQNAVIGVTSAVGALLLMMGYSFKRINLRIAATREVCAPYLWRLSARFGGEQDAYRELARHLGQDYGFVHSVLAQPLAYVAPREEAIPATVETRAPVASGIERPATTTLDPGTGDETGSQVEQATDGVPVAAPPPAVDGLAQAVLTALAEQPKPRSSQQGWMMLIISLVLFLSLGWLGGWAEQLVLLAVLIAFHEAGHYAAMRLFGYRDVRVFFIPFVGGATTASDTRQAAEWKQAVVSLAGPLPGLAVGLLLGAGWAATGNSLLGQAALFFVLLNGFNLLPFLPLDGGHFFDHVIFCRQRVWEAVFRVVAAAGLCAIGLLLGSWLLVVIALLPLLALPNFLKNTRIADELRREAPVPEGGLPPIPPREVSLALLPRVQAAFPQLRAPRLLADQIRHVWNYYGVRPPGVGATILLLTAYVLSIAATFVLGAVVLFAGGHRSAKHFNRLLNDGDVALTGGEYAKAERNFAEAAQMSGQLFHDRTAKGRALCKQAMALEKLGDPDAAEEALSAAEQELRSCYGLDRLHLVTVYETRARFHLSARRGREALRCYQKQFAVYEDVLGEDSSELQGFRKIAAMRLSDGGFPDLAEELLSGGPPTTPAKDR